MLRKLINNLPTTMIHLCETNDNGEVVDLSPPFDLPISDHDIIVGSNKHGTFATWNMLNPDSPVSPGFSPAGITGMRRIDLNERLAHLKCVAKMVIELFKNGVEALALQEVPAQSEKYFKPFIAELERLAVAEKLNLNFNAFKDSYRQTQKPFKNGMEQGYHGFATAILFKEKSFSLEKTTDFTDGRGALYFLKSSKSNEAITLINIHGDYGQSEKLIQQIQLYLAEPNTMVVGDTNIALSKKNVVEQFANISGVAIEPSSNIPNTREESKTIDCFVTTIPTSYIYKSKMRNYAKNKLEFKHDNNVTLEELKKNDCSLVFANKP